MAMTQGEREALDAMVAEELVRMLYSGFGVEDLRELLEIGRQFEAHARGNSKVLSLNAALAKEIERREKAA